MKWGGARGEQSVKSALGSRNADNRTHHDDIHKIPAAPFRVITLFCLYSVDKKTLCSPTEKLFSWMTDSYKPPELKDGHHYCLNFLSIYFKPAGQSSTGRSNRRTTSRATSLCGSREPVRSADKTWWRAARRSTTSSSKMTGRWERKEGRWGPSLHESQTFAYIWSQCFVICSCFNSFTGTSSGSLWLYHLFQYKFDWMGK